MVGRTSQLPQYIAELYVLRYNMSRPQVRTASLCARNARVSRTTAGYAVVAGGGSRQLAVAQVVASSGGGQNQLRECVSKVYIYVYRKINLQNQKR